MRILITGSIGQLRWASAAALALAAGILFAAACGGGDDGSASATISQEQLETWANEVWDQTLPVISASADFCPEDPAETPSFSLREQDKPDIPEEARPAVGALVAQKIYEYCRSQTPTPAAFSENQIQQWAEELVASGGAVVQCPSGTNAGVIQKPAVSVGFDAGSDIPEEARAAVGTRASEILRDACDPTPR